VDPVFHLIRTQLFGVEMVEETRHRIRPHLCLSHLKWLDPTTEELLQEVSLGQPLMPQLLKVLMQGLYLAEVLPDRPSP
jgi:hypothetical protein